MPIKKRKVIKKKEQLYIVVCVNDWGETTVSTDLSAEEVKEELKATDEDCGIQVYEQGAEIPVNVSTRYEAEL